MDFTAMKRKQLQALCKKHRIPANLTNQQMALRLSLLLQPENATESDKFAPKNVKKVKFSPENETIIFIDSDSESPRTKRLRNRNNAVTAKVEVGVVTAQSRKRTREAIESSGPQSRRRKLPNQDVAVSSEDRVLDEGKRSCNGVTERTRTRTRTRALVDSKIEEISDLKTNDDIDETCEVTNQENVRNPSRTASKLAPKKGQQKQRQDATKVENVIVEQALVNSLPIEENSQVAPESEIDPDLQCDESSEDEKYDAINPVPSAPVLAVNQITTEMTLDLLTNESVKENSQDENIQARVDDQLVQQLEDLNKDIVVIPEHSPSLQIRQIDSESEHSKCLDIDERLETEEPVVIGLRSNGESDDSGQDDAESQKYFENLFEEPEIIRPVSPQAINTELVEKINFCNDTSENSKPATEEGADQVLDETTLGREAGIWECVQERGDEKTEGISTMKEQKFEEALNQRLPTFGAIPSCNIYDALVGAGTDDASDSVYDSTNKNTVEVILTSKVAVDVDNIESPNKKVTEQSSAGDAWGSQNHREGQSESTEKEAIAEEKECRDADNDKSNGGKSNEDLSNDTNELNHQYDVSIPEFSEELHDDHKGAAEEYSAVNDGDLIPEQPLCGNGTDNVVKLTEETLEVHPMDENSIRSEGFGAHADLSSPSQMIQEMNADCFISFSDNRNSEHRGHTAPGITTSLITSEEGNIEYVNDLFEEANSVSENNAREKKIDEKVIMMEDFEQASESQLRESSNKTAEASIKDTNEQDDASAIIQEYMESEIQMEGSTKLDYFGFLNTGKMTRVLIEDAETNSVAELGLDKLFNDCGEEDVESSERMVVEEKDKAMVADAMDLPESDDAAPFDCDDVVPVNHKISGTPTAIRDTTTQSEEVEFEDVESSERMVMEEKDNGMVADEVELQKSDDAVPVNHKISEIPTAIRETTTQSDEVKFEDVEREIKASSEVVTISEATNVNQETTTQFDEVKFEDVESKREGSTELDGNAFMALDNSPYYKDGGRECGDLNSLAISFLSEAKVSGDSVLDVSSDDIQCKLGDEEAHGCNVDDLDIASVSTHGNRDVSINESGDESLEQQIDSDDVKFGIEAPNSSPKVEKSCILDSTATEFLIDSTVCSSLTGKESECQANKQCVINHMDGGIVPRETDSPMQGNIQLGTPHALICSTTTAGSKIENKTADSDADSPLFTSYELNLFSEEVQTEEADKLHQRRLEENSMSDTNGDMQRGITEVNISEVSIEQGYDVENEMIVDTDLLKNKLVSGDSTEAIKCTKPPLNDENKAKVQSSSDSEGPSFDMKIAEATEVKEYGFEVNDATAMCVASDGSVAECEVDVLVETVGNNTNEFEYSINFVAECGTEDAKQVESGYSEDTGEAVTAALSKIDSKEELFESSEINVEISDEQIFGNEKDDFLLEKCQQTNDIENSYTGNTESGGKDLKTTGNEAAILSLNLDFEEAVNENGQENSSERNMYQSINQFAESTKKNNINVWIPASPNIIQKTRDMKENFQSGKREQIGSVSMSRKSAKRRPLEELPKHY